jgi:hypothetical protein
MANKAHTATLRRLAERYGVPEGQTHDLAGSDPAGRDLIIEVETLATLADGVRKLERSPARRRFVAMTNQESVRDALLLTKPTEIGVMDPRGDVVKEAVV